MNYFVSVIVPNYCHSQFLNQRIQSILNQTYKDFEIILLDDNSPDGGESKRVIEKYRNNPHVSHIVYNEQNSGSTFKQWNLGISLAKGDLVWIAESDDFCSPKLLESLVNEFKKNSHLTLAYSLLKMVDVNGKEIPHWARKPMRILRLAGDDYITRFMTIGNHCANASAALFKKNAALTIDKEYQKMVASGDKLFWIELAEQGDVSIVNEYYNFFRQHNNKVTPTKVRMGVNDREGFIIYNYILEHFRIGKIRKRLIRAYRSYFISRCKYDNESIRNDLYRLWKVKEATLIEKVIVKIYLVLQHRMNFFL